MRIKDQNYRFSSSTNASKWLCKHSLKFQLSTTMSPYHYLMWHHCSCTVIHFHDFPQKKNYTIQLLLFNIKIIRMCLVILGTCLQFHTPERDNSLSNPCQLIHLLHRGQRKRKIEKILKALHLPQTESNLSFINRFLDDTKHA